MKKTINKNSVPTLVVSWKDYESIAYERISRYVIHGKKGLKVVPPVAKEIGRNQVIFPDAPMLIVFRKRFTNERIVRRIMNITADNSDRYDVQFILMMK